MFLIFAYIEGGIFVTLLLVIGGGGRKFFLKIIILLHVVLMLEGKNSVFGKKSWFESLYMQSKILK